MTISDVLPLQLVLRRLSDNFQLLCCQFVPGRFWRLMTKDVLAVHRLHSDNFQVLSSVGSCQFLVSRQPGHCWLLAFSYQLVISWQALRVSQDNSTCYNAGGRGVMMVQIQQNPRNEIDLYWGVGRWRVTGQQTTDDCSRPNCPQPNLPGTIRIDQGYIKQVFLKRRETVKVKMPPNTEVLQMSQPQITISIRTVTVLPADSNHGIGGQKENPFNQIYMLQPHIITNFHSW